MEKTKGQVAALRFLGGFFCLLSVMFLFELTAPAQRSIVVPWTSGIAFTTGAIASLIGPTVATGAVIRDVASGFAIEIVAGCNGVEALIILAAAMLAFPTSWKFRVIGIVLGSIAVQSLNVLRVLSLFYLGRWNREVFDFAHLYLWQILILVDVLIVWMIWIRSAPRLSRP